MHYQFFALPQELRNWMAGVVGGDSVWCRAWGFAKGDLDVHDIEALKLLEFEDGKPWQIDLGRNDLALPTWEYKGGRRHLQPIKSESVQLVPSQPVSVQILLEGRLAVASPVWYKDQGVDPKPVQNWYRQLKRSLSKIMSQEFVICTRTVEGTIKDWPSMGISPGAVEWYNSGKLLKQFEKGPLIYHVRRRSSKNRAARKSRS